MGLFHRKTCENLLKKSKTLERIDRLDEERTKDPRKIYTSNISREVTPETLFKDDFATGGSKDLIAKIKESKIALAVGLVILFIVAMVLILII